ncbi:nucleolus and neural progenitor protein isoform X1 [Bufo gargarizans]|uniref:nucleolus and neural progenitor protein isoform X1 n=1 Tax=Bufo gargarizans TaxID=30331 RepID=UPI001CF21F83|nr:nucleolus and neural progenitor protein isoform X1 [Bufo gargarizans]
MAPDPWNRISVPRPAIQCQLTVPPGDHTEKGMKNLHNKCSAVHSFLKSKTLNAEVATLDSILYVYHHKLSCHKPYLALKQVQQCIRRIKSMGLEDSMKEMMDLCPVKSELEGAQYCTVPCQPILELVSMKILGSCKLLVRLMDCCNKAFRLCLQHLNLEEFIIINVVLLGLLSRLWVLHRGLLKLLSALYSPHISLQKEVSAFQKMPYFKDFVFPDNIEDHIGSVFSDFVGNKPQNPFSSKKGEAQFLSIRFDRSNLGREETMGIITDLDIKETKAFVDVGQPIQKQRFTRGKLDSFDVKTLFLPVKASSLQGLCCKKKSNEPKKKRGLSQQNRKRNCVKHLVPKIQEVADFKALAKQLLHAVKWCKERKLKAEAVFFRNRYLRCNRLRRTEALGYSLPKKLQCWKKSICHRLRKQTLRKDHLNRWLRIQRFWQPWKHMVSCPQRRRRVKRKGFKSSPLCVDLFSDELAPSSAPKDAALRPPTSELHKSFTKATEQCLTDADDIDDIFSSIGI